MKFSIRLSLALIFMWNLSMGQTTLLDDPGFTFTAVSGPDPLYEWDSPTIDISNCTSVELVFDFEWSLDWPGGGNMESADECSSCAGDPTDPFGGGCANCWDMLYTQVFLDGGEVGSELQGGPGWDQQSGFSVLGPFCTDGAEEMTVEFDATVHAVGPPAEEIEVSDIMIICWEAIPTIEEPLDVCEGGEIDLIGDADDTDIVQSWFWQTNGSALIDNDAIQSTMATNVSDGDEFTLTTTDVNSCQGTETIEVAVSTYDVEVSGGGIICEIGCTDEDSDLLIELTGGNPLYSVNLNVNGFPLPFVPSIDVEGVFRICSDPDVGFPEYDDSTDPPEITLPSFFFPIDIEVISVTDDSGCQGNIINGSVNYSIQTPPDINDPDSPEYCVEADGTIDLTLMNDDISTDGFDILWFEDEDLEEEISDPTMYEVANGSTVYAIVDDGDCISETVEVELDLLIQPEIEIITSPIAGCGIGDFFLPDIADIADIENAVNPGYYLDPNGENGPVTSIDPEDVDEIYIFDSAGENCFDEAVVPVQILQGPDVESPLDELAGCGELFLPFPTGSDIDMAIYNTEEDGTGDSFNPGDVISITDNLDEIFLIASNINGCTTTIELEINLENSIDYTVVINSPSCDSLILPAIIPASASVSYYTASMGGGMMLSPGDIIYAPFDGTLYIFDTQLTGDCAEEDSIDIVVGFGPEPVFPSDTTACEFLVLPEFGGTTGANIRYAQFPITDPNSTYLPGDTIAFSQLLYVLDTIGSCIYFDSLQVNINVEPNIGVDSSLIICEGFLSSTFNFMDYLGNPQTGGEWNYPVIPDFNPTDSSSIDLSLVPIGTYSFQYTIEDSLCGLFTSRLDLEVIGVPFGGNNNSLNLCTVSEELNFVELIGNPDEGGDWMQVSGPEDVQIIDSTMVDLSGVQPGDYVFIYVIEGEAITEFCEPESASLFIAIGSGANAGSDNSITACQGDIIQLDSYISADAETDGIFEGDNLIFSGNSWNTAMADANTNYLINYIVQSDDMACPNDTAFINIELVEQLNAGDAVGDIMACEGDEIDLSSLLINASAIGDFVFASDPTTVITDGLWIADTNTNFYHILESAGSCPADSLLFAIEVAENPQFNIVLQGEDLCAGSNAGLNLSINHQNVQANIYSIRIEEQVSGTEVINIDSLSQTDLSFRIFSNDSPEPISNDSIFIPTIAGIYVLRVTATDLAGLCADDLDIEVEIEVFESFEENIDVTLCQGDSYNYNGTDYTSSQTLTFSSGVIGCDSIININISNYPQETGLVSGSFCSGDTIDVLGELITDDTQTTLVFVDMAAFNCDSIVDVDVIFEDAIFANFQDVLCADESLTINGNEYDINNPTGMDTLLSSAGCDSILTINISFTQNPEGSFTADICSGESIDIGDDTYDDLNLQGTTILEGQASNGCDSIVNVDLNLIMDSFFDLEASICPGDQVNVGSDVYDIINNSGTTILPNAAESGCDSIVNVSISELPASMSDLSDDICPDQTITVGPDVYSSGNLSGSTILSGAAENGCDSIVNVNLNLLLPSALIEVDNCPGETNADIMINNLESLDLPVSIQVNSESFGPYTESPIDLQLTSPGIYDIEILGAGGCTYAETVMVDDLTTINLEIINTNLDINSYQLDIQTNFNYNSADWSFDSGLANASMSANDGLQITIGESTNVTIELSDGNCSLSSTVFLLFEEQVIDENIYIPNIIDINDPENGSFQIFTGEGISVTALSIYDRWGNLIFDAENNTSENILWDGRRNDRNVEQGVYVYKASISYANGNEETLIGSLTVIR